MADLDRLGDLLPPGVSAGGAKPRGRSAGRAVPLETGPDDDLARRVAAVWAGEMGPEIAANARPVQLRAGRLVVTTSSSAWAQTLQLMRPLVVERLNLRLGDGSVEKAVFRHAGWDPAWSVQETAAGPAATFQRSDSASPGAGPGAPAASATSEPEGLAPEALHALAEVDGLPLPPEVRRAIRQAMVADFVRSKQDSGRS